jgi:hypothetical protein
MAACLGLPIAPFSIVDIAPGLIIPSFGLELEELGAGLAFGSQKLAFCQEFAWGHYDLVAAELKRDILVFDWWIRNADRSLTEKGGNPNLLWDGQQEALVVIDHNVAFEEMFDEQAFLDTHVFRDEVNSVFGDWAVRQQYQDRLSAVLPAFDLACDDAPEEWWWHAEGVPTAFDRQAIYALLQRAEHDDFWTMTL